MAFAGVTLPNAASVGLHESLGFTPVGVYRKAGYKLGAWRDVGWWEKPLARFDEAMPPEPIPWKEMPLFEGKRVELGHEMKNPKPESMKNDECPNAEAQ